jgi:hypothetical protein
MWGLLYPLLTTGEETPYMLRDRPLTLPPPLSGARGFLNGERGFELPPLPLGEGWGEG